jgi:hypothetical protein
MLIMHDVMDHTNTRITGSKPSGGKRVPMLTKTDRRPVITADCEEIYSYKTGVVL